MTLTNDTVDAWLASIGKERPWLAEQIGISLGTLYNQFSHGFTKRTLKELARLMNPLGNKASGLELTFTHDEFMEITEAMRLSGYTRHSEFYHDAIVERAAATVANEKKPTIVQMPQQAPAMVAEDSQRSEAPAQASVNYKDALPRARRGNKQA